MKYLLTDLEKDLAFAGRQLWRNPGFTAATVLILALGIGANTAIFSALDAVLLEELPFRDGHELVHVRLASATDASANVPFSVQEYFDLREQNETLSGLSEYHSMAFTFHKDGEPERAQTGVVPADFFDQLGVRPVLGRLFQPGEDEPGADPVLLLTDSYWQKSFGRDPNVIGQKLIMDGQAMEVIGILPSLPAYPDENDIFMALSSCPFRSAPGAINNRRARMLNLYGRLKPGVSEERAEADLSLVIDRLESEYPEAYLTADYRVDVTSVKEELTAGVRSALVVLSVSVGLALVIACINVANLLLTRQTRRHREMAVRTALGAGGFRLTRQLLTESATISLLGGALGLVLAFSTLGVLRAYVGQITPRASEIAVDGRTLAFTFAVSLACGLLAGLLPVIRTRRQDVVDSLREGGKAVTDGGGRLREILVVVQLAVAFVLLTGALLTLRSFVNLSNVDAGFNEEDVTTVTLSLPMSEYRGSNESRNFYLALLDRLENHPQVESAAVVNRLPLDGELTTPSFQIEGRPQAEGASELRTNFRIVSPGYFRTLRVPLLSGRLFDETDHSDADAVTVISRSMAHQFWPGDDPVGERVTMNGRVWLEVVGVVADVKQDGLNTGPSAEMYTSLLQISGLQMRLLVRTRPGAGTLVSDIRRIVRELDPDVPISEVRTLEEIRRRSIASPRLIMTLLTLFAVLALVITATGIAGVLAYTVNQRRREIGIRLALGASGRGVTAMVVRRGMALVGFGLALGCAGAFTSTRFVASLLFEVPARDPSTWIGAALALLAVAGFAVYLPARQAAAGSPMDALRHE